MWKIGRPSTGFDSRSCLSSRFASRESADATHRSACCTAPARNVVAETLFTLTAIILQSIGRVIDDLHARLS
jgi:hypothetical protein